MELPITPKNVNSETLMVLLAFVIVAVADIELDAWCVVATGASHNAGVMIGLVAISATTLRVSAISDVRP